MSPPHGYGPILYEELARPWTSDSKGRGSDAQSVGVPGHSAPRSPDAVPGALGGPVRPETPA